MTPLFRKFLGINWILVLTMYGLLAFGVFAIHGAVWTRPEEFQGLWNRQMLMIGIGSIGFFATALIDYRWLVWAAAPIYAVGLGLLLAVQKFGVEKWNAKSWIDIAGFTFQPSQVAITGGIVIFAVILGKLAGFHKIFRFHLLRLLLCGIVLLPPFFLVLNEPDIGSAFVWLPILGAMLLVGSIPFRYLISIVLTGTMVLPIVYFFLLKDYQKLRIETYVRILSGDEVNRQEEGWDPMNLLIAVSTGGWEGKGYKTENSVSNIFLPEGPVINDYIFATVAEEHGFRGAMILISGLAFLILQCIFVVYYARDQFGRLLVAGTAALLFTHTFMNIGMNINLVPITGLPLPCISYGGTFCLVVMFLLGVTQSVWVHRDTGRAKEKAPEPSFDPGSSGTAFVRS